MRLPRILRPLGQGFWPDVVGALSIVAGVALGGLVFGDYAGLLGAVVVATLLVVGKGVRRRVKRRRPQDPHA